MVDELGPVGWLGESLEACDRSLLRSWGMEVNRCSIKRSLLSELGGRCESEFYNAVAPDGAGESKRIAVP